MITANGGITASSITSGAITAASLHSTGAITATAITASGLIKASTITGSSITCDTIYNKNCRFYTASTNEYIGQISSTTVPAFNLDFNSIDTNVNIIFPSPIGTVFAATKLGIRVTGILTCSSSVNGTVFNNTSDYRIKQCVQPITNSSVDSLNPVSYYNILSNKTDLGFIAHEVQPHFPMLVNGEKDGINYQSINYTGLIPVLVAEIKDLKSQVKILNSKVEQLMQSI